MFKMFSFIFYLMLVKGYSLHKLKNISRLCDTFPRSYTKVIAGYTPYNLLLSRLLFYRLLRNVIDLPLFIIYIFYHLNSTAPSYRITCATVPVIVKNGWVLIIKFKTHGGSFRPETNYLFNYFGFLI